MPAQRKPRWLTLDLRTAGTKHPGFTPALWAAYSEAAAVTLEYFHKPPSTTATVRRLKRGKASDSPATTKWSPANDQMRAAHKNTLVAAEMGAYVLTSAGLGELEGWSVVSRTAHATGADYEMLQEGLDEESFVRLEVSGMGPGTGELGRKRLGYRLTKKLNQLRKASEDEPGIAAVFGYELGLLLIESMKP